MTAAEWVAEALSRAPELSQVQREIIERALSAAIPSSDNLPQQRKATAAE